MMMSDASEITSGDSHEAQAPIVTKSRPEPNQIRRKGLAAMFTGIGKGETAASSGIALRSTRNRKPVLIILVVQFIKGEWKAGWILNTSHFAACDMNRFQGSAVWSEVDGTASFTYG